MIWKITMVVRCSYYSFVSISIIFHWADVISLSEHTWCGPQLVPSAGGMSMLSQLDQALVHDNMAQFSWKQNMLNKIGIKSTLDRIALL